MCANLMMDARMEQMCFKFCANLGKSATEILAMIKQMFRGKKSMNHMRLFEWHTRYTASHIIIDNSDNTKRIISCTVPNFVANSSSCF
jgi:hypothetical protein